MTYLINNKYQKYYLLRTCFICLDPTKVIEYETIRIIYAIVRLDKAWISNQTDLIIFVSELWASKGYQVKLVIIRN